MTANGPLLEYPQKNVSLNLLDIKIETHTCEMSILFTVFTLIMFGRTVETRSMFGLTTLRTS